MWEVTLTASSKGTGIIEMSDYALDAGIIRPLIEALGPVEFDAPVAAFTRRLERSQLTGTHQTKNCLCIRVARRVATFVGFQ